MNHQTPSSTRIGELAKATSENNNEKVQEIALSILHSKTPYPNSLRNYALSCLKSHSPWLSIAEPLELTPEYKDRIELIERNSWIFDDTYYSKSTHIIFKNREHAIHHYLSVGWKKGFDPVRFFKTKFYLGYADIARSGACPLVHYLEHGMSERRATADPFDTMYRAADLIKTDSASENTHINEKVGVFIHLFYPELANLIIPYLNNIPCAYDLFISTQSESIDYLQDLLKKKCIKSDKVVVKSFPNIGRDVGPFFCGFGENIIQYKIILKLHSKKSPHESLLSNWFQHILSNLLGTPEIVRTILNELIHKNTKLIYPIETLEIMHGIAKDSSWGHDPKNSFYAKPILKKWGIEVEKDETFTFPAGTMFWCQSQVLQPLIDLNLTFSSFDQEAGQIDGTLAHALERLIGISTTKLFKASIKTSFLAWNQGKKGRDNLNKLISSYPISLSGYEKVYHFTPSALDKTLVRSILDANCLDIHWVIPNFQIGAGGHMTIFRAIQHLEELGHKCTIWIHSLRESNENSTSSIYHKTLIHNHFLSLQARIFMLGGDPESLDCISGDVVIATDRMSTYPVLAMRKFLARAYFVQDHESSFFAVGSESYLTEQTYASANNFTCICASPWLHSLMKDRYGNKSYYFPLAVDHGSYSPCDPNKKIYGQIAFYVRRSTPRRLFAIGLLALHELFATGAKFSIVVFGEENTPDLKIPVEVDYRGILTSKELSELYRESYIGLVLSGTNYSLIPNEMMAVGLPVVDIDGEHTRMSYEHETVLLAEPNPKSIAKKLKELLDDKGLWHKHFDTGIKIAQSLTWEKSFQAVNSAIVNTCIESYENYPIKGETSPELPLATVVIPAYNGGSLLCECVQSVLRQLTTFSFEILIIDSSSSDGSIEKVANFPKTRIHKISKAEFGHGKTRNLGAQLANSKFVAYLTQDAVPVNQFWLQNLVSPMLGDEEVAGVFGAHIAHPFHSALTASDMQNHFYNWLASNHSEPIQRFPGRVEPTSQDYERFYSDNNSCLRKSVWQDIPYPDVIYGEDQMWADLILNSGFKKAFAPMAIVSHSHEYGFREALLRANTEWHFFNEHLGKQLPCKKDEVRAMLNHSINVDKLTSQSLGVDIDRRISHFARAAGYYLAGKGYGHIRP